MNIYYSAIQSIMYCPFVSFHRNLCNQTDYIEDGKQNSSSFFTQFPLASVMQLLVIVLKMVNTSVIALILSLC
jgi:hypothetical protein